jgi:hypothetical protein
MILDVVQIVLSLTVRADAHIASKKTNAISSFPCRRESRLTELSMRTLVKKPQIAALLKP